MAFRWRADDGPTLKAGLVVAIFQGIWTCIARKPYIFVIFQGGGGPDPLSPSLDPHMLLLNFVFLLSCGIVLCLFLNPSYIFRNFSIGYQSTRIQLIWTWFLSTNSDSHFDHIVTVVLNTITDSRIWHFICKRPKHSFKSPIYFAKCREEIADALQEF